MTAGKPHEKTFPGLHLQDTAIVQGLSRQSVKVFLDHPGAYTVRLKTRPADAPIAREAGEGPQGGEQSLMFVWLRTRPFHPWFHIS